jgi:CheY-like chemotaxis protein
MPPDSRLLYRTVLVVASEPRTGTVLESELTELGCFVGGPFSTNAEAVEWLTHNCADLALVDASLDDPSSAWLDRVLREEAVPALLFRAAQCQEGAIRLRAASGAIILREMPLADLLYAAQPAGI